MNRRTLRAPWPDPLAVVKWGAQREEYRCVALRASAFRPVKRINAIQATAVVIVEDSAEALSP